MDNRYKIQKTKCKICGRTVKKVMLKAKEYDTGDFFKTENGDYICRRCEREYHLLDSYHLRGYGFKYSTEAKTTAMDTFTTPTFGVELEVAGNIYNIKKIKDLTEPTYECSIGYDTSVEGAMFELSYAPGTYYWYLYESKLQAVCNLIKKDKWVKDSDTIGTHIHIGNINAKHKRKCLIIESLKNDYFWKILEAIGERHFNQYCIAVFTNDHHDAISYSHRWNTLEFRFFKGTYDFKKIMERIRFLRQLIDNTTEEGTEWQNFKPEIKEWCIEKIEKSETITDEEKQKCKDCFNGNFKKQEIEKNKLELILELVDEDKDEDECYEAEEW